MNTNKQYIMYVLLVGFSSSMITFVVCSCHEVSLLTPERMCTKIESRNTMVNNPSEHLKYTSGYEYINLDLYNYIKVSGNSD